MGSARPAIQEQLQVLIVHLGPLRCALPIGSAVEVMRPRPVDPLPAVPASVRGVAVIRGRPVPVVDGRRLLGQTDAPPGRFVVLATGADDGDRTALAVDAVDGIQTLDHATFYDMPPLLREAARDRVEEIATLDGRLLLVLDAARLAPPRVAP